MTSNETLTMFRARAADGRMLYPVPDRINGFHEWLTPVTELRASYSRSPKLIAVAPDVASLEYSVRSGVQTRTGYVLNCDSNTFPEAVTVEDWPEFSLSLGCDSDGDLRADALYRGTWTEQKYRTEVFDLSGYTDLPFDLMDPGAIVNNDQSFQWQVNPAYLVFGEVFINMMPGSLINIRERFAKAVKDAFPDETVWVHDALKGKVHGSVNLKYEDGRMTTAKAAPGRRPITRLASVSFPFDIPIPATISGTSKAAAINAYNDLVAAAIRQITSKEAVACAHCDGTGATVRSANI